MRHVPIRRALSFYLLRRLAKGQRLGLREDICQKHIVVSPDSVERLNESDEVTRNQLSALMDQLIERMLAIGSRLTPVNGTGLVSHCGPFERDMLTIALHGQLLQICREAFEVLLVRENSGGLCAEEI